jgi:hypothetical protein
MADSWFDQHGYNEATATGQVSAQQAETINRLMREGVPLSQIATATGLPASLIQSLTGYGMNGPNNQGGSEVEPVAAPETTQAGSGDALSFIKQWQASHPATRDSYLELANELKTRFGIDRYNYNGTPSNNEFLINGEKVKVMGAEDSSSPYWFAYGSDDGWGSGASQTARSLADFNAPSYSFQPYQQPAPFSYQGYTPGEPFKPPSAQDVLQDPSFQFRLDEGRKALESSASARGTLLTGGTLKDILNYGQNAASQEYANVFNRDFNTWGANEDQRMNAYTTDRNNAYQNYAMNLGAGQTGYGLNANQSLAAFNANLGAQYGSWDRNRLAGLDAYGEGQDYINNLFRYATVGQSSTGVPYVGRNYV